jgi:hypothetical protein
MFIRACLIGEKFAGSKALESLGQTVAENRPIRDSSPFSPHIWHSGCEFNRRGAFLGLLSPLRLAERLFGGRDGEA